ncbi:hypothetical protein [Propioniciclava soli]|uniref:hypothetical protein n=1 Tax=Propioniciclava soli TaxID=2775081 RepID=UPI001E44B0B8|nr:hypothetical protein [Propioniciclava soli]
MARPRDAHGDDEATRARRWQLPDWSVIGSLVVVSLLSFGAFFTGVGWLAGLASGVAQVRRTVSGRSHTVGDFASGALAAVRGNWLVALGGLAVAALLYMNVVWLTGGFVPGGTLVLAVVIAIAAVVWVVLVRAAALWSHGSGEMAGGVRWGQLVRRAAQLTVDDLPGTAGLFAALALTVGFVWVFPPIFILVPGLWVLAVTVVESRRLGA